MIRIPNNTLTLDDDCVKYLTKEYDLGTLSCHRDGQHLVFVFYNNEDEAAFILTFGNNFEHGGNILN